MQCINLSRCTLGKQIRVSKAGFITVVYDLTLSADQEFTNNMSEVAEEPHHRGSRLEGKFPRQFRKSSPCHSAFEEANLGFIIEKLEGR